MVGDGTGSGITVDLLAAVAFLRDAGLIGVMVAILWGGMRRWWVWGWAYTEMREQRDEWRKEAEAMRSVGRQNTVTAERGVTVAEQSAQITADVLQRLTNNRQGGGPV